MTEIIVRLLSPYVRPILAGLLAVVLAAMVMGMILLAMYLVGRHEERMAAIEAMRCERCRAGKE